jgi:hypothetical protein
MYSLKTAYLGGAKLKLRFLVGRVQFMFQLLRKGTWMVKLSENPIQQLVGKYFRG